MAIRSPIPASWTPYLHAVLRIAVAFMFIAHGTQKLFGFPAPMPAPITLMSLVGIAGILETFGGALILVGFLTRPVAFLLSGEMAIAYFRSHFPNSFWPTVNGGELSALFCFIFLYFSAAGAGPWSIDSAMDRKRP